MHHAQSQWDIRQSPNLYEVFSGFFGTPQLMVDINRCIFRTPARPGFPIASQGSVRDIHWDNNPRVPGPDSLQTVILLTDVGRDGGGFQCVPEIYQKLDAWLKQYDARDDFDFFNPGLNHWKATQIAGKATKRAPDQWRGLPGQLDPEPGAPAVLSELGMKLIGLLPW